MNKQVILTKGLPASGKSTWAKKLMKEHPGEYKRVNKDELRAMIDCGQWSRKNEEFILEIRNCVIDFAMIQNFNVIVDDTNLSPKHEAEIREMVKRYNDNYLSLSLTPKPVYEVVIQDFTTVSVEECIERDKARVNSVGERVIRQMYRQYLQPVIPKPAFVDGKPYAIIVDMDGTLALFGNANPYERDFGKDTVNKPIKDIVNYYSDNMTQIIILSGRKNKFESVTKNWLTANAIHFDKIFTRADEDSRKDFIIKRELYEANIKGQYNIRFVLDDRDQMVDFWRSIGLTCLQVNYGNF